MRPWLASLTATTLLTLAVACTRTDQSRPASSVSVSQQAGGQVRSTAGVLVATAPSNDCDWIPVADVEAIVGKLAEPPREDEGGCLYTLPVPQHVLDERAKMAKLREAIDKMPGAEKAKPRKITVTDADTARGQLTS